MDYHCAQPQDTTVSYRIYIDDRLGKIFPIPMCYSQPTQNSGAYGLWDFCLEYCRNQTAVPASIHSAEQNAFVTSMLKQKTHLGFSLTLIKIITNYHKDPEKQEDLRKCSLFVTVPLL